MTKRYTGLETSRNPTGLTTHHPPQIKLKSGGPLNFGVLMGLLGLLGLCACSVTQPRPPPTATATITIATPIVASPTPTATPAPTVAPTTPPLPTPDPATLLAYANGGLLALREYAQDVPLLCLRHEDLDADGTTEWLALVHQADDPPHISAFVLDSDTVYDLHPAHPKPGIADVGLGQYAVCDVQIRDVNVDGTPEIAIFGHTTKNETLLHLFAWDGATYRRLGRFSGDAGVRFMDADGDLELEIWEGYRDASAPSLAWHVIHTWENDTYGWTSDRYTWYSLTRPHTYPTHKAEYAVISFYLALDDRDLPGAYSLLTPQDGREYAPWAIGYATTLRVSVGDAHPIPASITDNSVRVSAMVTAWDNQAGVISARLWNVEWETIRTAAGWRLVEAATTLLEEWPVTYWP